MDEHPFDQYFAEGPNGGAPASLRGVVCTSCGYDLAGMSIEGVCPECGYEVRLSEKPRLENCPVELIRAVRNGLRVVFWAMIGSVVLAPVLGIAVGLVAVASPRFTAIASGAVGLVVGAISLYGWHLTTTPLPSMPEPERCRSIRTTLLALLVFSLIVTSLSSFSSPTLSVAGGAITIVYVALSIVSSISGVVVFFLQVAYAKRLAGFLLDVQLLARFRRLYVMLCFGVPLYLITTIAMLIFGTYFAFAGGGGGGGIAAGPGLGLVLSGVAMCGVSIGALFFVIMYAVSIYQLGSRVHDSLVRAERRASGRSYTQPERVL